MWWWFWDPLAGNGIQGSGYRWGVGLISLRRQGLPGRVLGSGSSGTVLPLDPGARQVAACGWRREEIPPADLCSGGRGSGGGASRVLGVWGEAPAQEGGWGEAPGLIGLPVVWSGRGTGRRAGSAAGQRWAQPAPGQFHHGDQGFGSVEPVGDPGQQTYVGVGRLAPSVTQTMIQSVLDEIREVSQGPRQRHHLRDLRVGRPGDCLLY